MRRIVVASTVATAIAVAAWACGSGSSSPSSTTAPTSTTPTVNGVAVSGTAPNVGSTSQFAATASFSNNTTQTVTSSATWASSNTSVATVNSAGLVTGVSSGAVDISATYQNISGVSHLTLVHLTFTVSGTIRDGTSNGVLPNVNVSAFDSADASQSTLTGATGGYAISGVAAGTVAVTASAASYQTTTQSVTVSADTQVNIILPRASSGGGGGGGAAAALTCNGAAAPATVSCLNGDGIQAPTAKCNDGTYSCSQNRSGTCSSHGGVSCWVCPGPLCSGLVTTQRLYTPVSGGFSSVSNGGQR